jgi:hypothetical protein
MKTRSQTIAQLQETIKDLEFRLDLPCELCEMNSEQCSDNHELFKYWWNEYMKLRYTIVDSCDHCKTQAGVPHCECGCYDKEIEDFKAQAIKPH